MSKFVHSSANSKHFEGCSFIQNPLASSLALLDDAFQIKLGFVSVFVRASEMSVALSDQDVAQKLVTLTIHEKKGKNAKSNEFHSVKMVTRFAGFK